MRTALGWAAYLTPVVLIPLGALIVTRSGLVAVRPFRFGICVAAAGLLLALGAAHGGWSGRQLGDLVARGVGTTGATILGTLLTLVGVLFLTGASLGAILRRSGRACGRCAPRGRSGAGSPRARRRSGRGCRRG